MVLYDDESDSVMLRASAGSGVYQFSVNKSNVVRLQHEENSNVVEVHPLSIGRSIVQVPFFRNSYTSTPLQTLLQQLS